MTLGATLRHARAARSLTRDDISRATRIPARTLAAMERDDWASLPGGIFTRGFVRAYAREVEIDEEAAVQQLLSEQLPPPASPAPVPHVGRVRGHAADQVSRWTADGASWRTLAWPAGAAILFVLYLATSRGPSDGSELAALPAAVPRPAAESETVESRPPAVPVGTASLAADTSRPADVVAPLAGVADEITVDLTVTRRCWLTVTVDGRRAVYRLVSPGEHERQNGRNVAIRAGDAGAVSLVLNGESARPLGASGEVVTVRITPENYRSLLLRPSGRP